jgi:hypothetical protein
MRCAATTRDGTPCQAPPLSDSAYCFHHDPAREAERKEARAEGGRRSRPPAVLPDAPDVDFTSVAEVLALLGQTASQVRRGQLDTKAGNCLAYISSVALRAIEGNELAQELADLRRRLEEVEGRGAGDTATGDGPAAGAAGPQDGGREPAAGGVAPRLELNPNQGGLDARPVAGAATPLFG